jgi:hypothetical protein
LIIWRVEIRVQLVKPVLPGDAKPRVLKLLRQDNSVSEPAREPAREQRSDFLLKSGWDLIFAQVFPRRRWRLAMHGVVLPNCPGQ